MRSTYIPIPFKRCFRMAIIRLAFDFKPVLVNALGIRAMPTSNHGKAGEENHFPKKCFHGQSSKFFHLV